MKIIHSFIALLIVGILLFVPASNCISVAINNQYTPVYQSYPRNIITVDDEPGDADYTSIREALNHSSPGDIIQVYSGTYYEHDIIINFPETLQGIAHELGSGNDTGKPVVTSTENDIFYVPGNNANITGFSIIDGTAPGVSTHPVRIAGDDCTFSYNNVTGGWEALWISGGTLASTIGTRIIGNTIKNTTIGVSLRSPKSKYTNISHNIFRWCSYQAICVDGQANSSIISYNNISNCSTGILFNNGCDSTVSQNIISASTGIDLEISVTTNISIMRNEFQRCGTGISLFIVKGLAQIRQNNFINNSRDIRFMQSLMLKYIYFVPRLLDGNYYDTWLGFGPKLFLGIMVLFELKFPFFYIYIPIGIPWFYCDWHPAQKPYEIPG